MDLARSKAKKQKLVDEAQKRLDNENKTEEKCHPTLPKQTRSVYAS
jgi:hypothetical protein